MPIGTRDTQLRRRRPRRPLAARTSCNRGPRTIRSFPHFYCSNSVAPGRVTKGNLAAGITPTWTRCRN